MDPTESIQIARTSVTAVASDDVLMERLVLKGGNALQLVHQLGFRASKDLDFSMEGDLHGPEDFEDMRRRLQRALSDRFEAAGYELFDFDFERRPERPPASVPRWWGGYTAQFKLIRQQAVPLLEQEERQRLHKKAGRPLATPLSPEERLDVLRRRNDWSRTYTMEISKYEYCAGKLPADVDGYTCYVYTPAMIAAEKLRALCQQMEEYPPRKQRRGTSRARDFYDIHAIATYGARVDLGQHAELVRSMFQAKEVPLWLLGRLGAYREFHRASWNAVEQSVTDEELQPFDVYFDFVLGEVRKLEPLWVV